MEVERNPGAAAPAPSDAVAVAVATEDALQALVEYLVAPLLPLRPMETEIIDPNQEVAVAKQMHAVVMLYNYYHRKQFPQLEFLGFESFCKLAVISKPSILMYMKLMSVSKEDYGDLDNQLSVTEKMVMDACKICKSLDASIKTPNMESWPISKVAVFLVDPAKEKCLLQFCSYTQGVWSLVEKDLDMPLGNLVRGEQNKKHKSKNEINVSGSLGGKSKEMDDLLEKTALSAARDNTGIDLSNLSVLEHHIAYSLSSDKTTTRLYIMMYRAVSEELTEVPLKDVLSCLRDPLFKRNPSVEVAPAVEYYHLLPFADILADYLSREAPHIRSLHLSPLAIREESCLLEPMMEGVDVLNKCVSPNIRCNKIRKTEHASISKKRSDPTLADAVHKPSSITGELAMEIDGLPVTLDPGTTDKSLCSPPRINAKLAMELDELPVMGDQRTPDKALCRPPRTTVGSSKGILSKGKIILPKTVDNINGGGGSYTGGATKAVLKKAGSSLNHDKQLSPYEGDTESRTNSIPETHIGTKDSITNRVGENVIVNGFEDKAVTIDSGEKLNTTECINGEPVGIIPPCDTAQEGMSAQDLRIVPVQATSGDHDAFQLATAQKKNNLLQASLRILHKKLDELCRQQRVLQEEIAECEMNIQTISNGGEAGVGSNIELIIEACNNLCRTQMLGSTPLCFEEQIPQQMKRKRLSEAVLTLQSPSQELDNICRLNCWMLPRYNVFPSLDNGMYQASVMVQGIDFQFTVDGALKSKARDARDSAASNGLTKLRGMAEQAQ